MKKRITDKDRLNWIQCHTGDGPNFKMQGTASGWSFSFYVLEAGLYFTLGRKTFRQTVDLAIKSEQAAIRAEGKV